MYDAAHTDRDEQVRTSALSALVRCKEPRVGAELQAIARDRHFSPPLRAHAAALLGGLGDRAQLPRLIALFVQMRQESIDSDASLRIALAAGHALGELGAGDAPTARALADAAEDPTFPELQANALNALGKLCPPGVARVFARAATSDDSLVVRAARSAERMCTKR
jgi:HEAT repeat protein